MSCDNKNSMTETLEGLIILYRCTFLYNDIIQNVDFFSAEWVNKVVIFFFLCGGGGLGANNKDVTWNLFNTKCDSKDSISFCLCHISCNDQENKIQSILWPYKNKI